MNKFTILPLFFALLIAYTSNGQSNEELLKLFEEVDQIDQSYEVENPIWRGVHPSEYVFEDINTTIEKTTAYKEVLNKLRALEDDELTEQDRINKAIKILQLDDAISRVEYKIYLIPFNSEGGFFNFPSFFLPNLPFNTPQNFESYIKWLPSFGEYIDYNIELLKQGEQQGILAPKVIVENILKLLDPWTANDLNQNPFFLTIERLDSEVSSSTKEEIQEKLTEVIRNNVLPSYRQLKAYLETDYLNSAPETVGIREIKNGGEYYENRVRHFTTLDLSPDSVFQIGQKEVKRIRAQMNQIISELAFEGSFEDFLTFLRTDPQFFAKSPQELLNYAAWLSKKAEGELPRLFSKLYELPFTVAPVPADIAPNYTGGRYVGGSRAQNRPGTYWVNTYNLPSRTLYTLPALSLHEAVPGHHLQIQIASELTDIPDFRRTYYISAFGEGWGLYSEYLGEEMGMYETPYDLFGRYTYEMWRACRLVVDVGMHYKGWTREEAVKFMASNTALSLHEVNTEIDRYIGWPGQALSYKIGELKIKELRKRATEELGGSFDIQKFHEVILKNGSIPLSLLEEQIDDYITEHSNN